MISRKDFRKRQIDTLKIFNDNVSEIKENEEYSIQFESGDHTLTLTVILSVDFPNENPKFILKPSVQHPWCNYSGFIDKAPGVLNYNQHSDLGRVVQVIIREFEKHPPLLLNDNNKSSSSLSSLNTGSNDSSHDSCNYYYTLNNDQNSTIPELTKLSLDELKKLDSDPQFFDDFIEELNVVQTMNSELDSMINQVEIISKENQSKENHLKDLKTKLYSDVDILKCLGEKCEKLNQKYMKKSEEFAPQHIRELLQIATSNSDTVCEKHVEQFLSGKMDVQTFLNCYTDSKKISAMRKSKEERLAHQLNAFKKAEN